MVRLVLNNGQYKITIPKDFATARGWNSGTRLLLVEDLKGNVKVREV